MDLTEKYNFVKVQITKIKQLLNYLKMAELQFDEKLHKYFIDNKELESVTTWIERRFKKPFDSKGAAIGKKRSSNAKGVSCLNPKDLMHYWKLNRDRAASLGTSTHLFAEMYDLDPINTIPEYPKEHAFVKFSQQANKKYQLVATEFRVYSEKYGLAGTIDRIYKNPKTGEIIIADLKTNGDLHKYYNRMINEMSKYQQTNLNSYTCQLTVYDELYKEMTGKDISERWIVWLKDDKTFEVIKTEKLPEVIKAMESNINYDELF